MDTQESIKCDFTQTMLGRLMATPLQITWHNPLAPVKKKFIQSCPTLCDPMDCSLPGLSMEFSRQESWSGLPFPSPGDLPDPGIEPRSPALQADSLLTEPSGKPSLAPEYALIKCQSHFTSLSCTIVSEVQQVPFLMFLRVSISLLLPYKCLVTVR